MFEATNACSNKFASEPPRTIPERANLNTGHYCMLLPQLCQMSCSYFWRLTCPNFLRLACYRFGCDACVRFPKLLPLHYFRTNANPRLRSPKAGHRLLSACNILMLNYRCFQTSTALYGHNSTRDRTARWRKGMPVKAVMHASSMVHG
jgi:hypothetical protein